jgi:hypothetical protein
LGHVPLRLLRDLGVRLGRVPLRLLRDLGVRLGRVPLRLRRAGGSPLLLGRLGLPPGHHEGIRGKAAARRIRATIVAENQAVLLEADVSKLQ